MISPVKRLQKQFSPEHYELFLNPDRDKQKFRGTVVIQGYRSGPPSKRVVLHQKDLKILSAEITHHTKSSEAQIVVDRINTHKKYDELRLHTKNSLRPGKYTIKVEFSGKITKAMSGIYPCFFEDNGKQKQLIATQFESHYAREVFPCIDEPAAKATFALSLVTPKDETVLSNTPILDQTPSKSKNYATTSFVTTPKMSTYLLAFAYGDLGYLQAKTKAGTIVRSYATKQNVKFTKFALDTAVKCLDFYSEYYGIDFPLPKCDLLALPDFASGAMENWGLITFREQTMFVDPDHTSLATKQYVALVVAHELAHQWFGNLVTMRWWTDLWLNEGFASWMEYFAIDHIFPEWQLWVQFAVDEQQRAFSLDSLSNTHPIEVKINHPDEIRTIFDTISYSKGSSVLNMLHNYVGKSDFKNGLRYYLEKHAYSNTDTVDLWKALEEVSGKPVEQFMHTWTSKPGYPILKVSLEDNKVELSQERFFINPAHRVHDETLWPIALLSNHEELPSILSSKQKAFRTKSSNNLLVNRGQSGFYRAIYNPTHLEELGNQIRRGRIDPIDRLGILSNVFETAKAGDMDTVEALHFISYFENEDNFAVWDIIASSLVKLRHIMDEPEILENMKPYIRKLVSKQLKRLGWDKKTADTHFDKLLRPIILGLAASADQPEIIAKCRKLFDQINFSGKGGATIDPDLKPIVFKTVARLGGKPEFDKLLKLYNHSNSPEDKNNLCSALQSFAQPELIDRALGLIKTDKVRLQDVPYWIFYGFVNRYEKKMIWEWTKQNWQWLEQNLGGDLSFHRLPIHVVYSASDKAFIKEYKNFFTPLLSPVLERSYRQGLEILEYQCVWRERSIKEVANFFKLESN